MQTMLKPVRYGVLDRHLVRLERIINILQIIDHRFFWIRLSIVIFALINILLIILTDLTGVWISLLLLSIISFVIIAILHRRLDTKILKFKISNRNTKEQLSRMKLDWDGIPAQPQVESASQQFQHGFRNHPFENDLEIIGARSIQHLIDNTVSQGGSNCLRSWLLAEMPNLDQILFRQSLLRELIPLTGFRNKLVLQGEIVSAEKPGVRWDGDLMLNWIRKQEDDKTLKYFLVLLLIMAAINIVLFLASVIYGIPPVWLFSIGLYGIVYNIKYRQYHHLFGDAYRLGRNLEQFKRLFVYLEKYPYPKESVLKSLCEPFWNSETLPSRYLKRITAIISAASVQNNQILWFIINALLPWDLYFTHRLQIFRSEIADQLPVWLETFYQLEAVNALANFAYLNPDYTIPSVQDNYEGKKQPCFVTKKLGHPLLVDEVRVCNDFQLDRLGEVIIISGSNMSGKSTFLKTLGVNLCLAFAGGPVNATALVTNLFRLFTAINVIDSLSDGISYFYAEVKRLKALLDAYNEPENIPVFFLIDEIFRGTNNKERQIGSRAYVRALGGGNGVGVISTHDLALVHHADDSPYIKNFHFREQVIEGRMFFDYFLREGPCPTTNALTIMALEGLPIE